MTMVACLVIDQGDDGGILDTQTQVHHVLDAPSQAASHIHTDDGDIDNEPGVIAPSLPTTAALSLRFRAEREREYSGGDGYQVALLPPQLIMAVIGICIATWA